MRHLYLVFQKCCFKYKQNYFRHKISKTFENFQEDKQQTTNISTDDLSDCLCHFTYLGRQITLTNRNLRKNKKKEPVIQKQVYTCEGKNFCGWKCEWTGFYEDILKHFLKDHSECTYLPHQFKLDTSLRFDRDSTELQLINKKGKLFW